MKSEKGAEPTAPREIRSPALRTLKYPLSFPDRLAGATFNKSKGNKWIARGDAALGREESPPADIVFALCHTEVEWPLRDPPSTAPTSRVTNTAVTAPQFLARFEASEARLAIPNFQRSI
ncbi:hypothetical protein KM043_009012 [Ampulex compressa]|nr:hypothetical protein KM043_009012 [Ampulex compressa]